MKEVLVMTNTNERLDDNLDPLSGAPGSHPVGTGVGAASGGVAGAAAGMVAGPVGAVVGAAVGAIVGGLAGKGVAESINPTAEDAYWREQYRNEPYFNKSLSYDEYAPAYRTGYEAYGRYRGKRFDDVQAELEREYNASRGKSSMNWTDAKRASRAAWDRVERALPGDANRNGK
jgi:hypothetical protein